MKASSLVVPVLLSGFGFLTPAFALNETEAKATVGTQTVITSIFHNAPGSSTPLPPPGQDEDNNGLHDLWEMQKFGYLGIDPTDDPDGDGLTNLQEFQAETDPHVPHPGWVYIALPAHLIPVDASPDGTALLRDETHYWRWHEGSLTRLGEYFEWEMFAPRQFRDTVAVLNRRGDVAIQTTVFNNQHDNSIDSFIEETVVTWVYPVSGTAAWSYSAPSKTAVSDFTDSVVYDEQGNFVRYVQHSYISNALDDVFLAEDGALWGLLVSDVYSSHDVIYDADYQNFIWDLVRIESGQNSTAMRTNVAQFIGLDGTGRPVGTAYVSVGGFDEVGFVGAETVDYLPSALGLGGRVISLNEGAQSLHEIDGTERPLPANYNPYFFDAQGRVNGLAFDSGSGQLVRFLLTPTGTGGAWQQIPYTTLPLPTGWSGSHQFPLGSEAAQIVMASINGAATQPVLTIPNPARLLVDANRDGEIKTDGSDITTFAKPHRFWINDDNDHGDVNGDDIPNPNNSSNGAATTNFEGDGAVDGARDLVDFFPVFLDLKQLLAVLPHTAPGVKYKLKQADGALNFVYTKLNRADALKYQTEDKGSIYGPALNEPAVGAGTRRISAAGVELSTQFLTGVKDQDWGVILVESWQPTTKLLVLSVERSDGTVIAEVKLDIKISSVEDMYRRLNFRDSNGRPPAGLLGDTARRDEDLGLPTSMVEPTNFPDSLTNGKWFIFVVGSNVGGQRMRGWQSEVFKRMYWSQSTACFLGVSWYGDPFDDSNDKVYNYHAAVRNAFATAPALASFVNGLSGSKTISGHSLGCGVVAAAMQAYGMNVDKALLLSAAFALECFEGAGSDDLVAMVPPNWADHPADLWAARWHQRFTGTSDERRLLTWRDEFINTVPKVYSFYSSTEEVLRKFEGSATASLVDAALSLSFGNYAWTIQEKVKGDKIDILGVDRVKQGSDYGGWGFNLHDPITSNLPKWYVPNNNAQRVVKTPMQIGLITAQMLDDIKIQPLFKTGWGRFLFGNPAEDLVDTDPAYYTGPSWVFDLYGVNTGSIIAEQNRIQLLAEAIPALSLPVGANNSPILQQRNFNLPELYTDDWPRDDLQGTQIPEWKHSDMRVVAYRYQSRFYDKLVELVNQ